MTDEDLCQLTADYLARRGFHVEAAHRGEGGAEWATAEAWHAVILDVMLPDSAAAHPREVEGARANAHRTRRGNGLRGRAGTQRGRLSAEVAVLPVEQVSSIIASAGFETPVLFLQTGLIHAWYAQRTPTVA